MSLVLKLWSFALLAVNPVRALEAGERASATGRHPADSVAGHPDPFVLLAALLASSVMRCRLVLGLRPRDWCVSAERRNVAIMGAPRGGKGGHVPTMVAAFPGTVVWVSARPDEGIRSTGLLRGRMAGGLCELIDLAVDGSPTPRGLKRRGSSPVTSDWERAQRRAKAIVEAPTMRSSEPIWASAAVANLAALLLAGGIDGLGMDWLRRSVKKQDLGEAIAILREAAKANHAGAAEALDELQGLDGLPEKTKASVLFTIGTALAPYSSRAVLEFTETERIDWQAVVRGRPDAPNRYLVHDGDNPPLGCFPTVYVRANVIDQDRLAIPIASLLTDFWDTCLEVRDRPPVLIVLDDMAALAHLKELPNWLSVSGGAGVLFVCIFHDEAQLHSQWGAAGKSMVTSLGEKLVWPGIEEEETRNRLSVSTGRKWVKKTTASQSVSRGNRLTMLLTGQGQQNHSEGVGESVHEVPRLTPAEITTGHPDNDPENPGAQRVQHFGPDLPPSMPFEWLWSTPYWSPEPMPLWLKAQVASMQFLARHPDFAESVEALPLPPELHRDGGKRLHHVGLFWDYWPSLLALMGDEESPDDDGTDPARSLDPDGTGGAPLGVKEPDAGMVAA
jgi:hypothetical protein